MSVVYSVLDNVLKKLISMGDGTYAEQVLSHPPFDLLTDGGDGPNRRMRVDVGQTGFFAGREARTWFELNIPNGTDIIIKAECPVDFILFNLEISLIQGELKVHTLLGDGADGGGFTTLLPIIPTNTMSERPVPFYEPQMVLSTGGIYADGTPIDLVWLKTSGNSNKAIGVGGGSDTERGVGAATYYYRLSASYGNDVLGVLSARWEERI